MVKDTNFLYKLSSIRQTAFSFLERGMKKAGLVDIPPSYGDILYLIHNQVHHQKTGYIKDIVDRSNKDKSTVSNIINHLEKKGYVRKMPDPEDGRRTMVRLTPLAESHTEAMFDISRDLRHRLFRNMSEEEQKILFLLLEKVEKNLKI